MTEAVKVSCECRTVTWSWLAYGWNSSCGSTTWQTDATERTRYCYSSDWLIPLPGAAAAPSALQCVSVDRATVGVCAPPGLCAAPPAGPAASCGPPSAPCSPAGDAGSPSSRWTHRERWEWNWRWATDDKRMMERSDHSVNTACGESDYLDSLSSPRFSSSSSLPLYSYSVSSGREHSSKKKKNTL